VDEVVLYSYYRLIKKSSIITCFICCGLFLADIRAFAYSASDVNTMFGAFNSTFYFQNGNSGYFKNDQFSGETYFWGQAEEIECVIDAYEWNTNAAAASMITNLLNGFINNNGTSWTGDGYNDDILWAVMAFARGGMDTGQPYYCSLAKANFDACFARAWSTNLGGGLYWLYPDNASKNACVNGPGSIAASLMYKIYGTANYWNDASNIYTWEHAVLFNSNSGAIYDNIGTNGAISTWSSTYNQGTFIGAANFLGRTNDAALSANFTMMNLTTGGILPQYGIAGNNSGFNDIYLRWFVRYMLDHNLQSLYEPWLQLNATAAWNSRRADNLSWCQWPLSSPPMTNFYSWDCLSSFEALEAAQPPQGSPSQPVPINYISYWPLDATSGTTAVDISGNGNQGTLNGANVTWNSSGRINGCLSFNGNASNVSITNRIDNDFSISFWVKTTQTTGAGQWYNGTGLVDGDIPGVANDFGTALLGGKFAFGIGNPDTTITSTVSINDGQWHQCVATRQQATGLFKIYVDGVLQASGYGNRNTLNATTRLSFGMIESGGGYFNGSLDDVKMFNRTLNDGEVSGLYNSIVLAPTVAPVNLTATPSNALVQLSWWPASNATSYNIKRSLVTGGPYVTVANVTSTTYVDTVVTNNQMYYYVVSAVNNAGESPNSTEASVNPLGLMTWLKADAITNLSSGSPVSLWNDSSGNGFVATQPVGSNQPVYVTGAMNGMAVVRFNATNDDYLWFYRPVQDNFTIICVFQSTQGYGSGNLYYQGAGLVNGEVSGTNNDFGTCLFANGSVSAGTGNPDTAINSAAGFNNGSPHILVFLRTKSSGIFQLFMDGSYVNGQIGNAQSLTAPNQLVLGALQTLNNYLSGDIAEVQIYNTALPTATMNEVVNALKCKYGIVGSSTLPAPTGLTALAGNRTIALNWSVIPGVIGYNLWRSTNAGASFHLLGNNLGTSSFMDTTAVNGQTNLYQVAANDDCGTGAKSSVAGVLLPLPLLGMNWSGNSMTISWPGWANDWGLYWTTNLTPPAVWSPVNSGISSNAGTFNAIVPATNSQSYFRLSAP
jgi:hypothetical protein